MNCAKRTLLSFLCIISFPASADVVENQYNPQQQNDSGTQGLAKYVLNLGAYLGYDLSESPSKDKNLSNELTNRAALQLMQNYVFTTYIGAIPVNAASSALSHIMPNNFPGASIVNAFANASFNYQNYSSPSNGGSNFSVTALMDQETFQKDPVSQAVLNILSTPDYSVCIESDGTWKSNCEALYQNKVMSNVIGPLPLPQDFYSYTYNQPFISQLNSNALLAPLMYSTESAPASSTSSPDPSAKKPGLPAENQLQIAANFIRYASGAVTPITLPNDKAYAELYNRANPVNLKPLSVPSAEQVADRLSAQATLNTYFTSLRVYAAQSSVGIGNLYYLMSKRLPQNQSGAGNAILTSQALSEFNMATWRLFNAGDTSSPNKQWLNQINEASSATVQKEIATLLAEINYQMYLDRQLQERILLTNTIMLMQNTKVSEPTSDFTTQGSKDDDKK